MGIDTKIYVPRIDIHPVDFTTEVAQHLKRFFGDSFIGDFQVEQPHRSDPKDRLQNYDHLVIHFSLDYEDENFSDRKEHRTLHFLFEHDKNQEVKRDFTQIIMGAWGHNREISLAIINKYGGFVDLNDCDYTLMDYACSQHETF